MGKNYHSKKLKKKLQINRQPPQDSSSLDSLDKQKKIVKEPKTKQTILSDIELQIIDMFSKSFTNGQIGVKYPQQKKKGMMRLMNFCFRTIIEEAELYINPTVHKEAHSSKYLDKKQRTIFYLSSNYRYKHIDKSLLEDFKIICRNYVKYHSLQHLDPKFIERFYKKMLHNEFRIETSDPFKNKNNLHQNEQQIDGFISQNQISSEKIPQKYTRKPAKVEKIEEQPVKKKTGAKRGRKRKNFPIEVPKTQTETFQHTTEKKDDEISMASIIQPTDREMKSNRICIEKINIYLGYDASMHGKGLCEQGFAKLQTHPYARIEVEENYNRTKKGQWSADMEAELIDQFMNTSAVSPNIIIRNLMKKFGRNKLFVDSEIQSKREDMFKISRRKFISGFEGKSICSGQVVKKIENTLKGMNLNPKNYQVASFIHDFYFKEVKAISVTLLSQYMNKFYQNEALDNGDLQLGDLEVIEDSPIEKTKILERNDLKYALKTMSKLVESYNYDMIK